jgi:Lar family restriction alleviation protein
VKHGFIAKITLKAAKNARQKVRRLRGMENELKPCPFCGGEATLKEIKGRWAVYCLSGCAGTQIFNEKQKPVEAWNRRTKEVT